MSRKKLTVYDYLQCKGKRQLSVMFVHSEDEAAAAEEAGKTVSDPDMLYFRKPDVNHEEGFKLAEGTAVTFKLYIDDKGAGACDVSQA